MDDLEERIAKAIYESDHPAFAWEQMLTNGRGSRGIRRRYRTNAWRRP